MDGFRLGYESHLEPLRINTMHSWTLILETPAGEPIDDAVILVSGDKINVFESGRDVILVRESNVMTPEGWSFENLFWVDPQTGFVWRSVQHIAPGVAPIEIDVLRPPRVAR